MKDITLVVCTRDCRNELVKVECETLTGKKPVNGIAEGGMIDLLPQSAYLRAGMRILARGKNLGDLQCNIRRLQPDVDGFRIELFNLSQQVEVQRRKIIVALADAIERGRPNLDAPRHRLLLIIQDSELIFGEILAEPDHAYRRHDDKPYRTSSSLPARLARALVNLVRPYAKTILDPCCGTGSTLLEAQAMGLKACGGDWNPKMVGMSRQNIAHFGYAATIELLDARAWSEPADAIVTDLPYGKNLEVSPEVIRGILKNALNLSPVAVFVAGEDIRDWLRAAGYREVEVFQVPKHKGFVRYVHRAWI